MHISVVVLAFAAAVAASPYPWAQPQVTDIPALPTNNGTEPPNATTTRHQNPHKEPTPTFKLSCECPKPIIPVDQLTPAEKCEFEFGAAMACYYRAQGGCPSPTLACNGL
ncbi:hypothetical protein BU24DRAFT_472575 [Aaosphaeria arxii CBS 175.79]|uniref:Uncharacterized protein n=1 Tax=Aaosphaeria arxii CBS 175.79 TaxID=1450172 RepID=A0A6A5XC75_9PLEO|nr:uncharacterized protein BU24DRAFT_472575 [Aaosphaeria arxii CBS 175.79]KAF2010407.1 hypothetical protein BU24DRAFT_472575 [Aaosphaeria arxii CBS 175.79]